MKWSLAASGVERFMRGCALATMLAGCDNEVSVVGGGGASAGGAPGNGGETPIAGAAPSGGANEGGQGGEANEPPVCPTDGACVEEPYCVVTDGSSGGCRNLQCDLPAPCDDVEFIGSGGFGTDPPFMVANPDALACLLTALRDGTVGTYRWFSSGAEISYWGDTFILYVHPDRIGLGYQDGSVDLGVLRRTLGPFPLREPSFFEDCAAAASADAAWACLEEWLLSGCP